MPSWLDTFQGVFVTPPSIPTIASSGPSASRHHGRLDVDKNVCRRDFPRVVSYTRTTAFLFAPSAVARPSSLSSPLRPVSADQRSSRRTVPSDYFTSAAAVVPPPSTPPPLSPRASPAARHRSSHLAEPLLIQALARTNHGLAATTAARQPLHPGSRHCEGVHHDEGTQRHACHITHSHCPRPHNWRPAGASSSSSSTDLIQAETRVYAPVAHMGSCGACKPHAQLLTSLYHSVAGTPSEAYQHCGTSATVVTARERMQTRSTNVLGKGGLAVSNSLPTRGGDECDQVRNARPDCTFAAPSSLAISLSADSSSAKHYHRQGIGCSSTTPQEQQLQPLGQRVRQALLCSTTQGEAVGGRTRCSSPLPSSKQACSENTFQAGIIVGCAPTTAAFRRKGTSFEAPTTGPHVDSAHLVTPLHDLPAATHQVTSPLRHASVGSSQLRQRTSPCDVLLSKRNATVMPPVLLRSGSPPEESLHNFEALPLTSDDSLACISASLSPHAVHAVAHGGVGGLVLERVHDADNAHSEGWSFASAVPSLSHHLLQTIPLSHSGAVPSLSPSSRQVSLSAVHAWRTHGRTQDGWRFGHFSSCCPCVEEVQQQQLFLAAPRCDLLQREEAAAREGLALGEGAQLHHIICRERAAYRLVDSQQHHRRLPDTSIYNTVCSDATDKDLVSAHSAQLSLPALPGEARSLTAMPQSTQRLQRIPSAGLRPLLCLLTPISVEAHDEDEEKRLRSFSLSTSPSPPGGAPSRLSNCRSKVSAPHDQVALVGVEEVRWLSGEDKFDSAEDAALSNVVEGEPEQNDFIRYSCHEAAPEGPTTSMCSSDPNQRTASPQSALPPSSPCVGLEGRLLACIRSLYYEEEDLRFLLTGECPPPDVFQRWADRYFQEQRASLSPVAACASQDSVLPAALSPESVQRSGSRSSSPPIMPLTHGGGASVVLAPVDSALSRIPAVGSHDSSIGPLLSVVGEEEAKQADTESLWRESTSSSRHRLCSEHRRAWAMENLLGEDDACASYHERRSAGLARSLLRSPLGKNEFNASGRHAPDPQIFGEGQGAALCSAFSLPLQAAPSPPSAPWTVHIDGAATLAASGFSQQLVESVTGDSSLLHKMAFPTEKTYLAPLGSERNAWQTLMDEFIDGLLRIMTHE
ncbi:hypothetical protein LPMP_332300 [Leishmania panamensis]|uniref:Uncharacterized protein n=1 Tax=Leishmania panamensis TaxID=5679 RepID=A0A088RZY3_LEIPA|nr:hypothetical protein LPMP_332300 [Leishmania panamensis]AIO01521.1 hypothetical protein LPMP_332300 [Leishmania panamensis]